MAFFFNAENGGCSTLPPSYAGLNLGKHIANYCTVLPAIFISVLESFSRLLPWFLDLFQLLLSAFTPL